MSLKKSTWSIIGVILAILIVALLFIQRNQFEIPEGETVPFLDETNQNDDEQSMTNSEKTGEKLSLPESNREVFITDGVKHSIPLDEILSGGPPKDGIPSIDEPKFIDTSEADEDLDDDDIGLGLEVDGEARFYPYEILVWHEIVNDTFGDPSTSSGQAIPVLVTYCPLCQTGIVFERRVNGVEQEFGVSGKLWKSNLLMYNRTGDEDTESLWSQVLGEAVLGPETGNRLSVISSDTVMYGDWKEKHPDTEVLSRETGTIRPYGTDPYGDYYTSQSVSFGAEFDDDRLHPKAFVLGIELNGQYKAYDNESLPVGITQDTFAGQTITVEKDKSDAVTIFVGEEEVPFISGFWFSWLAVHPDTQLWK